MFDGVDFSHEIYAMGVNARLGGSLGGIVVFSFSGMALAQIPAVLPTGNSLRVVTYNINADTGSVYFNAVPASTAQTVFAALGLEGKTVSANSPPPMVDVFAFEELQGTSSNGISPTLSTIVNDLNSYYTANYPTYFPAGTVIYKYDTTPDPTDGPTSTGNGPSGMVYNSLTVTDLGASLVGSGPSSSSDPRQPIRFKLQPKGYGSASDVYLYVEHAKASGGSSDESERANESVVVRENADSLPAGSHIIYSGDFNLAGASTGDSTGSGSAEYAYKNLVTASGTSLKNSSGTAAGTAGTTGQAYDPLSPGNNFLNNTNTYEDLFTESATEDTARFDMQLISTPMETGSSTPGVQLVPNSQLAFGNGYYSNGALTTQLVYTTNKNSTASVTTSANYNNSSAALSDLSNRQTVLTDLTQLTDHLPMISDYALYLTPGDANGDGLVNATDISILQNGETYGLTGWNNGDFNGDGKINADDFTLLEYGIAITNAASNQAPEPGALAMVAVMGIGLLGRKRR